MVFSHYEIEVNVTVGDVKTALNDVDADVIPDETIEQKISEEKLIVAAHLPDDLDELAVPKNPDELDPQDVADIRSDAIEMLIRRRAARHSWHSSPTEVRQQALDAARSFDVQGMRGKLNDSVDEAYAILGLDQDGTSAAFTDATGSVLGAGRCDRRP